MARQLLADKDLLDWPLWVTRNGQGTYKSYVKSSLARPASTQLKDILKLNLPWNVLLSQRAVIQLRRGYVELGHVGGRKSTAKIQECIFCAKRYSNVKFHVIHACIKLDHARQPCAPHFPCGIDLAMLDIPPCHPGYEPMALFAQEVVRRARVFWT